MCEVFKMTPCTNNAGSEWNRSLSDDKAKLAVYNAGFSDEIRLLSYH